MRTFDSVAQVAQDAAHRVKRVTCFFQCALVAFLALSVAIDRLPPTPKLECEKRAAVLMSPYPHPYGEPPASTWTVCEWNPPKERPAR